MRGKHTKRHTKGYSLTEVLIVVAIIGILAAVAIPNVIAYRRSLKLTELDDNARTIYLAAQNNLAALRSAAGDTLELGSGVGRSAASVPSGAVSGLDSSTQLKYVSTDVAGAEPDWLVLPGSVDPALREEGSYYLVEFDPASGVVYGVFYTESGDGKPLNESVYQTICQYSSDGHSCRVRQGRDAFAKTSGGFLLGYYGADGALDLSRPESQKLPTPKLKLTNAEELALDLTGAMDPDSAVDPSKVFYAVSLSDGVHAKTLVEKGKFNDGATNTVVLDTLKSGYSKVPDSPAYGGWSVGSSFTGWDTGVTPGADVTVTVTAWYQPDSGEGMAALPQSASVSTNSLFGQRAGETVQVGYGRHLQNLGLTGLDSAITAAVQVREIDFAKTTPANDKDKRQHWAETYGDKTFVPIENAALNRFDGQGRAIRNLNATAQSGKNAGLFETLDAATVEAVTLVDAKASAPGQSAGALGGIAKNSTQVKDCQVYLTATNGVYSAATRISGTNAGGLIGWAQGCAVESSFASTVARGIQNTGGLVGCSGNVNIKTSYAAGRLSGPRVGGLVGGGSGVTMTDCYAAGLLVPDANGEAAGLCAMEVTSATRCYAAADYATAEGTSYAIVGAVPGGSCNSVYYLAKSGVNDAATVAGVDRVASSDQLTKGEGGVLTAFYAFKTSAAKTYPYNHVVRTQEEGPLKAPYPYPALGDLPHYGDWLEATAPNITSLVAYYEQFLTDFGYATEYSAHINGEEKGAIKSATRTEALNADGYAFLSLERLHNDWEDRCNLTVTATGETTLQSQVSARYLGTLDEEVNVTGGEATYYAYAIPSSALDVRPASGHYVEVEVKGTFNASWDKTVETQATAWINPYFGRAAHNGAKPTSAPSEIHIRSLRQLANVGRFFGVSAPSKYVQDLDVDASIYYGDLAVDGKGNSAVSESRALNADGHVTVAGFEVWGRTWSGTWDYSTDLWSMPVEYHLVFNPIGEHTRGNYSEITGFGGVYDGNGRTIQALSIRPFYHTTDKANYTGLFYRVSGTLSNINMVDCDVMGESGSGEANSTGVLIGRLNSGGQVYHCTVKDCAVTVRASTKVGGHAGGLVGYSDNGANVIQDCRVENTTVTGGNATHNVGGLVGWISKMKSSSVIRDCTVKNTQVSVGFVGKDNVTNVTKQGSAGGFVGCMSNNEGKLENCFVVGTGLLSVSGSSWHSGGFAGIVSDKAGSTIQGCGVRLEGSAKSGYAAQMVSGGKCTGGFVGTLVGGSSLVSDYAAVRVDGARSGGFVGSLEGGAISNSYAGGHTQNGKYSTGRPNVTGTERVGGLIGLWKGGEVTTCYTTCAVSGPNEAATDVFANQDPATVNSSVTNCYALGEAFAQGAKLGKLTKTTVAVTRPKLDMALRTEAHPYDTALTNGYPFAPVRYADGATVPHYGDWPDESSQGVRFEWTPEPERFEPVDHPYLDAGVDWNGNEVNFTFVTKGYGSNLANQFAPSGGHFAITTDLGYVMVFKAESNDDGSTSIYIEGGDKLCDIFPVEQGEGDSFTRTYEFSVPTSKLPLYVKAINLGGYKEGYIVDDIKNRDPAASDYKPVEPFLPGDTVHIDGDFSDWDGYSHQLLVHTPGNALTDGNVFGAAFGEGNVIYLHVINEYRPNLLQPGYSGSLTIPVVNMSISVKGDDNWESHDLPWWKLTGQSYTGPGIYKLETEKWSPTWQFEGYSVKVEAYLVIRADGSQEIEMAIYLDEIAGKEAADQITEFRVDYGTIGGSLTIWRDPPEQD